MYYLSSAIARSSSHNEIMSCEFSGTHAELLVELAGIYDGEIDSVVVDGTIDVWGFSGSTPEGDMDWRLSVTLVAE